MSGVYDLVVDADFNEDDWNKQKERTDKYHCPCSANGYLYKFGDVYYSNWYRQFLSPDVHEKANHLSAWDCFREFRCLFHLTLEKVKGVVSLFLNRGWACMMKHCKIEHNFLSKLSSML
jgi:hypothetical protein